jgi:hypothetical protein
MAMHPDRDIRLLEALERAEAGGTALRYLAEPGLALLSQRWRKRVLPVRAPLRRAVFRGPSCRAIVSAAGSGGGGYRGTSGGREDDRLGGSKRIAAQSPLL